MLSNPVIALVFGIPKPEDNVPEVSKLPLVALHQGHCVPKPIRVVERITLAVSR